MNERDPIGGGAEPLDDDAVARLIQDAGARQPVPREDLDAIAASARAAWRERVGEGVGAARSTATRPTPAVVPLALAALIAAMVAGLVWWVAREGAESTVQPLQVATVEAGTMLMRLDEARRSIAVGDAVPAGAVLRTRGSTTPGPGLQRGALRLASGVLIRVDAGTELRLESASRIDLLSGALYADTHPVEGESASVRALASTDGPAAASIEVHTLAGTVRDVGTQFIARVVEEPLEPGVQAGVDGSHGLVVLVRDGRIAVQQGHDGEPAVADAGEQLRVRGDGTVERAAARTFGPEWEWVLDAAPRFAVAGRSIAEILDWVSRETGWTVRYEDDELAQAARSMIQQASRSETIALRADQAAFVLLPSFNLEGALDAGVLTVERR